MSSDYKAEIERRIQQFRRYLEPMDRRALEEARGSCFLVFENRQPGEDPGRETREERQPAHAAVVEAFGGFRVEPFGGDLGDEELLSIPEAVEASGGCPGHALALWLTAVPLLVGVYLMPGYP